MKASYVKACDIFISAMGSVMTLFPLHYYISQWVNILDTLMGFVHFRVETLQSKQTRSKVYKHSQILWWSNIQLIQLNY